MLLDIPDPKPITRFIGLDLGQANDYTAAAILEKAPDGSYDLRQLDRERGRPYPELVRDVARLLARPEMAGAALAVDQTGVGRGVLDQLREALPNTHLVLGVTITSGHSVTAGDPGCVNVPKKDLVGGAQLLLQGRRLRVAGGLPLADTLARELAGFRVRITAHANETFGADWRENLHDDLVFAVALAIWLGENAVQPYAGPVAYPLGQDQKEGRYAERVERPVDMWAALADLNVDLSGEWEDRANPWRP